MTAAKKAAKLEAVHGEPELPFDEDGPGDGEAEADDEAAVVMVKIPYRGIDFAIPKEMDEWDTEACLAMNQGNYVLAAKILLGTGQWAGLQALGSKRKDVREFLTVFAAVIDKECIA